MPRPRISDSLTLRGHVFLATGCALILGGVALGFRDVTRVGVLIAGLPLVVLLFARRPVTLHTAREVVPAMVAPDQVADVTLRVRNDADRATPIAMAEEQLDYSLGDRPRFLLPRMAPGESHQLSYRVRGTARGRHRLGPLGLRIRDPFDLTLRLGIVRDAGELIVLPTVVPLGAASLVGGLGQEGSVPHLIALHGEDDVSVREWREGDDLRRIHWPATARTGDLMVRQEDRPATRRVVVLLDDRARIGSAPRSSASFEWAVTATASIAQLAADSAASLHLVLGGRLHSGMAAGEPLSIGQALLALAMAEPRENLDFLASIDYAADAATTGAVCIAVVAAMDDSTADRLARIRPAGSLALALVQALDADIPAAQTTAARLRERGWASTLVLPGTSVPQAWAALQATVRSGATR